MTDPIVEMDPEPDPEGTEPFTYDEEAPNLVAAFKLHKDGKEALKKIGKRVKDDFEKSYEATERYRLRTADDWRLWAGELPPKNFPFKDAANCHVPVFLEAGSRLAFRLYGEIFANWNNVFGVVPMGPDDSEQAEMMSLHDNWQLRSQIPDFKRQMHRLCVAFVAVGDVTVHSFYDDVNRRNAHEVLTPEDFVIPYVYTSTMPNYGDVPFMVKILHKYGHELEAMEGLWEDIDKVLDRKEPHFDDTPEQVLSVTVASIHGQEVPSDIKAPYKLLWYEGWMKMPLKKKHRYVKAIVDPNTETVLSLSIHEQPNWQDKQRHERQSMELSEYRAQLGAFQQQVIEYQLAVQQHEQVLAQVAAMAASPTHGEALMGAAAMENPEPMAPPPPVPPSWVEDPADITDEFEPEPARTEPIRMFTHFVCMEPLLGNLGLSYGRILADHNRAANTAMSQFIDAATLSNCWGLITAKGIEFEEPFEWGAGKIQRVTGVTGSEIRSNFYELKPGPPSPELLTVVQKSIEFAEGAVQAPGVLSGEPGKSGETYRGHASRVEQATKNISVSAGKICDSLEYVLRANAALNALYLPEEELLSLFDYKRGIVSPQMFKRTMWERDYNVEIRADLRFATLAQRIGEADEMLTMAGSIPHLSQNPAFVYASIVAALRARGKHEMIQMLGPAPPPPQVPFGTMMGPPGMPGGPPGQGPPPGGPPMEGPPQAIPGGGPPPAGAPGDPSPAANPGEHAPA